MYILVRTYVQRWKSHCCSIFMRVFLDSYYCGLMTPGSILWLTTYRCCLWQSNVRLWPYSGCISKWWRYEACKQLHSFWHRPKAFWEADWVLLCFRCQVCLYTCNTTTVAFNRHCYSIKVKTVNRLVWYHMLYNVHIISGAASSLFNTHVGSEKRNLNFLSYNFSSFDSFETVISQQSVERL